MKTPASIAILILVFSGCQNPMGSPSADAGFHPGAPAVGATLDATKVSLTSVDVSNNLLTLNGTHLDGVKEVRVDGVGAFTILSQSASRIVAVATANLSLAVNTAYDLLVTSAEASSTSITFTLGSGAVTPSMLDRAYLPTSGGALTGALSVGGDVGIHTSSPPLGLSLSGAGFGSGSAAIDLANTGTGGIDWRIFSTDSVFGQGAGSLLFYRNGTDGSSGTMVLSGTGRLGLHATAPVADLGLGGDAARVVGVERNPTAGAAGKSLTLTSGSAAAGSTDQNAGDVIIQTGTATGNGGGSIYLKVANNAQGAGTTDRAPSASALTISGQNTPSVGINDEAPQYALDAWSWGPLRAGNFNTVADSTSGLVIAARNSNGDPRNYAAVYGAIASPTAGAETGYLALQTATAGSLTEKMRIDSAGKVGIGTTAAAMNLEVHGPYGTGSGTFSVVEDGYGSSLILDSWGDTWFRNWEFEVGWDNAHSRDAITSNQTALVLSSDGPAGSNDPVLILPNGTGKVGVGSASPSQLLTVGASGDGSSAVANAWNTFSDIRLKRDLKKIVDATGILGKLSGYYYYWRVGEDERRQVGVIAQEVEKVLPELVTTDKEGMKSVDYPKLTAVLIEAVKEQSGMLTAADAERSALRAEVAHLKSEGQDFRARLERLEKASATRPTPDGK